MTDDRTAHVRGAGRWLLAGLLGVAGIGHFLATQSFLAQVPTWLPARTGIVYVSGAVELVFAGALVALPRHRTAVGWALAAYFLAIFPGNVHQAVSATTAFGLDSAAARWSRLAFQPVLIAVTLWSTGAWRSHTTSRDAIRS